MNNRLYGSLIFELSQEGRRGYSLSRNRFGDYKVPSEMRRKEDARLPECDELTVVRHYTNHSANNFGVNNGFYPLGSCTMKYNPAIDEEVAAMPEFANLHPLQPHGTVKGAEALCGMLSRALQAITGMAAFTFKPYAGAHGELAGLMSLGHIMRVGETSSGRKSSSRTPLMAPIRHRHQCAVLMWSR